MANLVAAKVRKQIQDRLFDTVGFPAVLLHKTGTTFNERGEEDIISASTTAITVIPYVTLDSSLKHERFGDAIAGEKFIAFPTTIAITTHDTVVIDGINWELHDYNKVELAENIVTLARLIRGQL